MFNISEISRVKIKDNNVSLASGLQYQNNINLFHISSKTGDLTNTIFDALHGNWLIGEGAGKVGEECKGPQALTIMDIISKLVTSHIL